MDTSKHTVTIPVSDYNSLIQAENLCSQQAVILEYIENVLRNKNNSDFSIHQLTRHAMNNWIPQHDLEDEE